MAGERMMASANLIGKKVPVPDAPALLVQGQAVEGFVSLPTGAEGVKFQVFDSKGILVATQIMGSQAPGDMTWSWNGADQAGNTLPDGNYRFTASAVTQGKTTTPSVSTLATVIGVSQSADQSMLLQVQGGKTVKFADVKRIDG